MEMYLLHHQENQANIIVMRIRKLDQHKTSKLIEAYAGTYSDNQARQTCSLVTPGLIH